MKRSISQFKKFSVSETAGRFRRSWLAPLAALTAASGIVAIASSCQMQTTDGAAALGPDLNRSSLVTPPSDAKQSTPSEEAATAPAGNGWFIAKSEQVFARAEAGGKTLFEVSAGDCSDVTADAQVRFVLQSPFALHRANAVVHSTGTTDLVTVEIDGERTQFSGDAGDRAMLRQLACAAVVTPPAASEVPTFEVTPRLAHAVRDWARFTAPDCDVDVAESGGFTCKLPQADAQLAREELVGIRGAMIRGWTRQPYLLARRVAVGIEVADALNPRDGRTTKQKLDTLCKIIRASLAAELPMTLTSRRWQSAACEGDEASRRVAAAVGLAKTVAEIDFLRQLFERTSRLGSLVVRLPTPHASDDRFLVTLEPGQDVVVKLTRETERIAFGEVQGPELSRACWHPLYGEDRALLALGRRLAISGEVTNVQCAGTTEATDATQRYIAESLASETEFVLQNGRSKTLRLPTGSYGYTIRALPKGNVEEADDYDDAVQSAASSKGRITWDDKRPRPFISVW